MLSLCVLSLTHRQIKQAGSIPHLVSDLSKEGSGGAGSTSSMSSLEQSVTDTDRAKGNTKSMNNIQGLYSHQPQDMTYLLHSDSSNSSVRELCQSNGLTPTHPCECTSMNIAQPRKKGHLNLSNRLEDNNSSIIESFNTLSVSSQSSNAVSHPVVFHRSCREEAAAASVNSFDDTTVDDLAGYLDQIMFLPKPMSEMAELMYT